MFKKIVIMMALAGFTLSYSACTSNNSKDDADQIQSVDNAGGDLEKVEGVDVAESGTVEPVNPILDDPAAPAPETVAQDNALPADPLAQNSSPLTAEEVPPAPTLDSAPQQAMTPDQPAMNPVAEQDPLATIAQDNSASQPPIAAEDSGIKKKKKKSKKPAASAEMDMPAPEVPAPVVQAPTEQPPTKVVGLPWRDGATLYNTVYFARPGDSFSKISKMVYGNTKSVEALKKGNPGVSKVRAGDAIYFNSPNRPDDETKVITYYEDKGASPEIYISQKGDKLKKVAKKLLSYPNAWKEIWATNSFESMDILPEGTEIHYWKSLNSPAKPLPSKMASADNGMGAVAMGQPELPPPPPPAEMPPPPTMAQNDFPPPPAEMPPPPPPPQPPVEQAPQQPPQPQAQQELPPPPPPPPAVAPDQQHPKIAKAGAGNPEENAEASGEELIAGLDQETLQMLGGVAIGVIALVGFVIVRKKRKMREMEQVLQDTHVG